MFNWTGPYVLHRERLIQDYFSGFNPRSQKYLYEEDG